MSISSEDSSDNSAVYSYCWSWPSTPVLGPSSWQANDDHEIATRNLSRARKYTDYCSNVSWDSSCFLNVRLRSPPAVTWQIAGDAPNWAMHHLATLVTKLQCTLYARANVEYLKGKEFTGHNYYSWRPGSGKTRVNSKKCQPFNITFYEKLKGRSPIEMIVWLYEPWEDCLNAEMTDKPDDDEVIVWSEKWYTSADFDELLYRTATSINLRTAAAFCPSADYDTPSAVETAINEEIERRINAERLDEIQRPNICFLNKLPIELCIKIYYWVLCPTERYEAQPGPIMFWPYRREVCGCPLSHTNSDVQLLQVSKAVYTVAQEVLYRHFAYGFQSPPHARRFLREVSPSSLRFIRRISLLFDPDVALHFFWATLAFEPPSHPVNERMQVCGYDFGALLNDVHERFHDGRITVQFCFPLLYKARYSWSGNLCHFDICKWIVKAAVDAVSSFNRTIATQTGCNSLRVNVTFKRGDGEGRVCKGRNLVSQDAWLRKLAGLCACQLVFWETLGVKRPINTMLGDVPEAIPISPPEPTPDHVCPRVCTNYIHERNFEIARLEWLRKTGNINDRERADLERLKRRAFDDPNEWEDEDMDMGIFD